MILSKLPVYVSVFMVYGTALVYRQKDVERMPSLTLQPSRRGPGYFTMQVNITQGGPFESGGDAERQSENEDEGD